MSPTWILGLALAIAGLGGQVLAAAPLTLAVVPKGTTHEFWKAVNAGAFKARDELRQRGLKVDVIWKGPLKEDDRDQQVQTVENFMTRRVNGIVLAPLDSQALVRPVVNAVRAKIPVVIIDSDLKSDQQVSFVATDNHRGGAMAARHLGRLLDGTGNVILLRYAVGSASTEQREAGFLETLKTEFPSIRLLSSDQHAGATRESAYQVSQNLLNRFGREVHGVFAPNETSTIAMTKALKDRGQGGGKVKMVGFDAGSPEVADLRNGDLQGLVVQDPLKMGYLGVMTLVDHLEGKPVARRIETAVT
ncbi:MAG: ABC transporter substrate-binding protein, partial [Limisphaerales bacterium]